MPVYKSLLPSIFAFLFTGTIFGQRTYLPDTLWIGRTSTDPTYGKTPENPIKIGYGTIPIHMYRYLNNLVDSTNRHVNYTRVDVIDTLPGKNPVTVISIFRKDSEDDLLYFDNHSFENPLLVKGYRWKEKRDGYYGDFADDIDTIPGGKGIYFYPMGSHYRGDWVNGKFHGYGVFVYTDGSSYQGQWENGRRNGNGRYNFPESSDSLYSEGLYSDGKPVGTHRIFQKNGISTEKTH